MTRAGLAGFYTQQNVGKRNVCIDLRAEGGSETVKGLASKAHVLIENFRPGVMARHGLSFAELSEVNPALVMLSISGFGQEGPESHRAAYAPVLHGESDGWLGRPRYTSSRYRSRTWRWLTPTHRCMGRSASWRRCVSLS